MDQKLLWQQQEEASELFLGRRVRVAAGAEFWESDGKDFSRGLLPTGGVFLVERVLLTPNISEPHLSDPVIDLFLHLEGGRTLIVHADNVTLADWPAEPRGRLSALAR
jgi:hypothetical protein